MLPIQAFFLLLVYQTWVKSLPLDVVESCAADNWGMPHQDRPPFNENYESELLPSCRDQLKNLGPIHTVLDNAMANFYANNDDYDNFNGVDLIPENHHLYSKVSPWGLNLKHHDGEESQIKTANCEAHQSDGSTWSVTKIGPFRTTGGYDWTQIGWDNLWDIRSKLLQYPAGILVTEQFSAPVLADGTRLGHPPIHVHHIHIGPSTGVRQRCNILGCFINDRECYDPTRVCEHHGDYQGMSSNNAGGIDIVSEAVPDGYGKHITFELGLEGDLNDVRAPGSEVIEWYYELGAKWIPFEPSSRKTDAAAYNNIKPVSFHNFAGPGDFYFSKQSSYIFTFQAPTDSESIFWYSGRMHQSGKLLRNKQHAHNIIFEEAIFFAASPEELGLTKENGLLPTKPFLPVKSASTRFGTNSEIKKFILENLKASSIVSRLLAESSNNATSIPNLRHRRFIEGNISISNNVHINIQHPHTTSNIEPQISMEHRTSSPKAICHSVHNYEMIGGYKFDRKTPTCCQEWSFKKGDIFTTLAFHRKVTDSSLGPHQADHPSIPPTIPGHVGWWLSYDTQELPIAQSHFSIVQYTNDPDSQYEDIKHLDGAVRLNVGLNRGITNSNNISSAKFLLATIIISIVQHFFLSILLMIALVFGFRRLYSILYGPGGYWANKLITLSAADNNIHDPSAPGVFEVVVKNCRD